MFFHSSFDDEQYSKLENAKGTYAFELKLIIGVINILLVFSPFFFFNVAVHLSRISTLID